MERKTKQCGKGCNHSDAEHLAFDSGKEAGETQGEAAQNPYITEAEAWLALDWEIGKSLGVLLRASA